MASGILIGGDLVPTESNYDLFSDGNAEVLIGKGLKQILDEAALRVFNLEVPLTDVPDPIMKCGPNLIAPSSTVEGYRALGADLLTLANNHIMDQGAQGLNSTRDALDKAGIEYLGAGCTPEEAAKPYIADIRGNRIGVYACAEHEFSIVSDTQPGANPYDPLESFDHVAKLKEKCSFVIVLYHGGKEQYRYPSPGLQKVCRKFIEKGADLVVCQHTHCIGCEEKYLDGTIVYGQGNFIFDYSNNEYWQTSLLINVDNEFKVNYIPLMKKGCVVRLAEGDEADEILNEFWDRSEEIERPGGIEDHYAEFANGMLLSYAGKLLWHESFIFKSVNKVVGNDRLRRLRLKRIGTKQLTAVRNYIECEAHRELFLTGIKNRIESN